MPFFKHLFRKERITIHPPMDLLQFPLADYSQSGKEAYVGVFEKHFDNYVKHAISSGMNPIGNRSLIYRTVEKECYGDILDVGACVGDFSLQLQNNGMSITAIDVSAYCVNYMKGIGIKNCFQQDILQASDRRYDTILLMGSTVGICERIDRLPLFLKNLKSMLNDGGQLIFEDVHILDPKGHNEFTTHLKYKHYITTEFDWFNIGPAKFQAILSGEGFETQIIFEHKYMNNYVMSASLKT